LIITAATPSAGGVNHQLKLLSQRSVGVGQAIGCRAIGCDRRPCLGVTCYDSLYVFKGARSAPVVGWPLIWNAHTRAAADGMRRSKGRRRRARGRRAAYGAGLPSFGPAGPRRRRRARCVRPCSIGPGAVTSAATRELQRGSSLRRPILKPCKLTGKGAPRGASHAMAQAPPLPVLLTRIQRRLSEGWPGSDGWPGM
jgi:hypothetical protein